MNNAKKLVRLHCWSDTMKSIYILTNNAKKAIREVNMVYPKKYSFAIAKDQRPELQKNDIEKIY